MHHETDTDIAAPVFDTDEQMTYSVAGETSSALVRWFGEKLNEMLLNRGNIYRPMSSLAEQSNEDGTELNEQVRLVINLIDADKPKSIRRAGQGTFVATVVEGNDNETSAMKAAYPLLVRSLSNMVIFNTHVNGVLESHFITIEQGHYIVRKTGSDAEFFANVYQRIRPLACSHLVINNNFVPDLPEALWNGDSATRQLTLAGQKLDKLGLLPTVFPMHEYLTERDMRHVKRLYNMGGLSYGNLSIRAKHNPAHFWMSASGVDKSKLEIVGRDILLVTDFEPEALQMRLSVNPNIEPKRVSVDAIEHFMIYREHPEVGAIIHVHSWWKDPIQSTEMNYPCGTYELARDVAELVRQSPYPSQAVIGLKNHGLTITGLSLDEIFDRIDGKIVPQVPMS
jgi:ribulose-5-phosphate 4-epimerase/fuculose-1-phosphate aldolase